MSASGQRSFAKPPARVAILRALRLGDLLCAVPMFRALRAAWPASEIILVGLPWSAKFVRRFANYLDGFRELPGYPGLPEREPQVERIPDFLAAMQRERFDLALQLHGSGSYVNSLTTLFGAQRSAGFYLPGEYCPDPETFAPWPTSGLEVRRLLTLATHLRIPHQGEQLEFPLFRSDFRDLERLPETQRLVKRRYVCMHPGASTPERRWPPECFAAIGDALAARGLEVVLTGTGAEAALTSAVARNMDHPAIDLAGETQLGTLAALISRSALVVCNDTGVSHVAAALGTASVVISTGNNPDRWAPANRQLHRVLCRKEGVGVEEAWTAVERQLAAVQGAGRTTAGRRLRRMSEPIAR